MANETPDSKTQIVSSPTESSYPEDQLVSSLARLQELHIQASNFPNHAQTINLTLPKLRQLRDAVPSMIRPMHAEHPSPETVYAQFAEAATGAVDRIRQFSDLLSDEKSRDILQGARRKREQSGEGVTNWLVLQHADWLHKPKPSTSGLTQGTEGANVQENAGETQPTEIMKPFKELLPEAKIDADNNGESIKVCDLTRSFESPC